MSRNFNPPLRSANPPGPSGDFTATQVDNIMLGLAQVGNDAAKTFIAADAAERLAIPIAQIQVRDTCLQLDTSAYYILKSADPSVSGNWAQVIGGGGLPSGTNGQVLRVVASVPAFTGPAYTSSNQGFGASITSGGTKMAGLGMNFTPQYTGIIFATFNCNTLNGSAGAATIGAAIGTGANPGGNTAPPGTIVTSFGNLVLTDNVGGARLDGSLTGIIDTLTPGTAYWLDLEIFVTGGPLSGGASLNLYELT